MEEVCDLLTAWGLPDLQQIFTRNNINIQALTALTSEEIKELIPLIGPRALFLRCWKTWNKDYCDENATINKNISDIDLSSCNISISALQDIPVLQEQETQTKYEHVHQEKNYLNENQPDSDNDLMKLLKDNFEASSLIKYVGEALPNENARNLLALIITKNILKENKNTSITNVTYNKWCREIKALFPNERITTYYIPPCVTAQGITHQSRGKLVSQVLNTRRKYQKLGVLEKRSQSPGRLPKSTSTSTESESESSAEITNSQECLTWLENSSEPWPLVLQKWTETLKQRKKVLEKHSIEEFFLKYPALQKPEGYTLLLQDFDSVYSGQKENLYLHFPFTKQNLIQLLKKKKSKDPYHTELLQLTDSSSDEELTNLAAVLSLPELINANVVVVPAANQAAKDSPGPSLPKKQKTIGKDTSRTRWKPTKAEAREAFVCHIKDDSYILLTLQKRNETVIQRGLTPQPYIAIVGPNLSTIKTYLVVVNPSIFYKQQNILESIDTCFKITWALNAEYSVDAYAPWYFIQKSFYKLSSPHDKGSTSAESLMTDCNLTI